MLKDRGSGILLHVTSLPSSFGIGDLGPEAYKFVDFLYRSKVKHWQILPLNPTSPGTGYSPYSSDSTFAGNILLISPEQLVSDGFLKNNDLTITVTAKLQSIEKYKNKILHKAFINFRKNKIKIKAYTEFVKDNIYWLDDYAIYKALKNKFKNLPWNKWSDEFRDREKSSLVKFTRNHNDQIEEIRFQQFIFFSQWFSLKSYCSKNNVSVIGDIPYYTAYDSADVWTKQHNYKLDSINKKPAAISGVPPDYFSETGQLWGNPVYNWKEMNKRNFNWWLKRIEHKLTLVDLLRLDHFRAFSAYWEVHAGEKTAVNGKWVKVPGEAFFRVLNNEFHNLPLIAEDLGDIDEPVRRLKKKFKLPGMKVLQFAFDHKINDSPDALHNHEQNSIVFTGTHDNPTTRSWFNKISLDDKKKLAAYAGITPTELNAAKILIRLAMMSAAKICVIPMQDYLNLGDEATMNRPGIAHGNWQWRLDKNHLTPVLQKEIASIVTLYDRD